MAIRYEALDEIHEIQQKHYEERKHLSWKEKRDLIDKKTKKFLSSKGYVLVSGGKGFRMIKQGSV